MAGATVTGSVSWLGRLNIYRRRLAMTGAVGPAAVLVVLFFIYVAREPSVLSRLQFNTLMNEAAPVAIAAAGETVIVLVGGFDLSAGAVLSLINVLIATQIGSSQGSQLLMVPLALAVGAGTGLVNGLLVNLVRIPSIVATLAMSFFWGGVALLILSQPGGAVPIDFVNWFTGNIGNTVPAVLVMILIVIALWLLLKRTALGRAIYAVGGDQAAAAANGIRVKVTSVSAYVIGGALYGLAGVFLTAQSASGDPNLGTPLLLPVFAAVVIGGTVFGGGRGDIAGSIIGAYILYIIADVLFSLGVSSFYTNILNGAVLLVAVVASSLTGVRQWLVARIRRAPVGLEEDVGRTGVKR
jgi:ribose transport system permease protein